MRETDRARPGAYRWLLLATIVATFTLIVVGATVRVTGSGLGCPDWPLCHGRIIPPLEITAILEYSHRLSAALTSPLLIASAAVGLLAWRRRDRRFAPLSILAVALLAVQVVLGAVTVRLHLPQSIVTVHLSVAEAILAIIVIMYVRVLVRGVAPRTRPAPDRLHRMALIVAGLVFLLVLTGAFVRGAAATYACGVSWPLCQGNQIIGEGWRAHVHVLHRVFTVLVSAQLLATAWAAFRARATMPGLGPVSMAVAALLVAQIVAGGLIPLSGVTPWSRAVHLAMGTLLWGAVVALATIAVARRRHVVQGAIPQDHGKAPVREPRLVPDRGVASMRRGPATQVLERPETRGQPQTAAAPAPGPVSLRGLVGSYVSLTKPRIISLLLVTALGGMFLAQKGVPSAWLIAAVMVGGYCAAGGANALNHYMDRDIDSVMRRTRKRPIPGARVTPRQALVFGIALNVIAVAVLWAAANLLAAVLAMCGTLVYVLVYTGYLKRSTPSNIVVGGAAGSFPPLVGWAAVTGGLALPALYLFAIIFFWTPPHFWALAMLMRDDYAAAKVPMLPVVAGVAATARSILLYTFVLVALTLMFAAADAMSWVYLAGATALGAGFVTLAYQLMRDPERPRALRLYKYSLLYLALLFVVIMVDGSVAL